MLVSEWVHLDSVIGAFVIILGVPIKKLLQIYTVIGANTLNPNTSSYVASVKRSLYVFLHLSSHTVVVLLYI